jgi:Tfp pilus assembly protein PilX
MIVTLMVLMLVSALMVGFVTAIIADQRASGLDRDQTQA